MPLLCILLETNHVNGISINPVMRVMMLAKTPSLSLCNVIVDADAKMIPDGRPFQSTQQPVVSMLETRSHWRALLTLTWRNVP